MTIYNEIIAAIDNQEEKTSLHTYGKGRVSVETEGEISYYITNEQGSVTDILDANGNIQATLKYDEFGILENPEAVSTNGNIFAYTGHVYDESTGLYYAKARYYDAEAGRMTSEDALEFVVNAMPNGYAFVDAVRYNLFIYAQNNPIQYSDPSGHFVIAPTTTVILVSAAGAVMFVTYAYLTSPTGQKAVKDGATAIYDGVVIAGEAFTDAAKAAVEDIKENVIWLGGKIQEGAAWVGEKYEEGKQWIGETYEVGKQWVGGLANDAWDRVNTLFSEKNTQSDSEKKRMTNKEAAEAAENFAIEKPKNFHMVNP